jgi:hypothetical protein
MEKGRFNRGKMLKKKDGWLGKCTKYSKWKNACEFGEKK